MKGSRNGWTVDVSLFCEGLSLHLLLVLRNAQLQCERSLFTLHHLTVASPVLTTNYDN